SPPPLRRASAPDVLSRIRVGVLDDRRCCCRCSCETALGWLVETLPIKSVCDTEADPVSSGNIGGAEVVTARQKRLHAEANCLEHAKSFGGRWLELKTRVLVLF